MRKIDWEAIKNEYVTGKLSYNEIAKKYKLTRTQVCNQGRRYNWFKEKNEYRAKLNAKIVENTLKNEAKAESDKLEKLRKATDQMSQVVQKALDDSNQFYRRFGLDGTEVMTSKLDTKAVRDLTAAIKDLANVTRNLYNIPTEQESLAMQIAREQLEIDRKRAEAEEKVAEEKPKAKKTTKKAEAKAKEVRKIAEGLIATAVKEKDNFEIKQYSSKEILTDKSEDINSITSYLEKNVPYDVRFTFVDFDGTVKFDSDVEPEKLENHLKRHEIAEALKKGVGEASRHSETIDKYTYYYAIKTDSGIYRYGREINTIALDFFKTGTHIIIAIFISYFFFFQIPRWQRKAPECHNWRYRIHFLFLSLRRLSP